jgi:hypothetical protein
MSLLKETENVSHLSIITGCFIFLTGLMGAASRQENNPRIEIKNNVNLI